MYIKNIYYTILLTLFISLSSHLYANQYNNATLLMEQGQYQQAIITLNKIISQNMTSSALVQRGEAYRILGRNNDAIKDLENALKLVNKDKRSTQLAVNQISLGQAYLQNQQFSQALNSLLKGLNIAKQIKRDDLSAAANNLIANAYININDTEKALQHYQIAFTYSKKANDMSLLSGTLINLSRLEKQAAKKKEYLYEADRYIRKINSSSEQISLLISLGYQSIENQLYKLAYNSLSNASSQAKKINNLRFSSEAQGYLGRLYEKKQRYHDALTYTEKAIINAQQISAYNLLLQWEWQQGRLQKHIGESNSAISSYRRAVNHIQTIRNDIPVQYHNGKSSFRETLAPIYQDLVELLLDYSDKQADKKKQELLSEALTIIERFKTAEMQDYFKNSCAIDQQPLDDLNSIAPGSAVIYPIIFSNHIELLVQIGNKKYHHRVDSPLALIKRLSYRVNSRLRPLAGGFFKPYSKKFSKQLYQSLIKPLEEEFNKQKIHTLVYAPDGFLRQLPLGALWTGNKYLIENYAIVTIPGLTLMEMKPIKRKKISVLLAGVSRPGNVVNDLPEEMQQILVTARSNEKARSMLRGIRLRALPEEQDKLEEIILDRPLKETTKDIIQTALELPGVIDEVKNISNIMPATTLLNDKFLLNNFEHEFANSYNIIHIASHGLFSGSPEKSFLIAHDRVLNMSKLEELFKSEAFTDTPVELLTLSACQTAEGDDRSPLGLSGVALKSGARSALGSLWPVADVVAKQLLPDFYNNLSNHKMSKAQALQKAKIKLLRQSQYSHPGLWASFILIGNWL